LETKGETVGRKLAQDEIKTFRTVQNTISETHFSKISLTRNRSSNLASQCQAQLYYPSERASEPASQRASDTLFRPSLSPRPNTRTRLDLRRPSVPLAISL